MPVTVEELKKAIRHEFPSADVAGIVEKNHIVTGTIVWKGFKNKELEERHDLLEKLGMKGINIGMLFPLAPGEKL
jgi:hypothetical protein